LRGQITICFFDESRENSFCILAKLTSDFSDECEDGRRTAMQNIFKGSDVELLVDMPIPMSLAIADPEKQRSTCAVCGIGGIGLSPAICP